MPLDNGDSDYELYGRVYDGGTRQAIRRGDECLKRAKRDLINFADLLESCRLSLGADLWCVLVSQNQHRLVSGCTKMIAKVHSSLWFWFHRNSINIESVMGILLTSRSQQSAHKVPIKCLIML